ncbi:MAG: hypothetical protein Q4C87_01165 [Actinomycetaceae bacterium]|nr:hypothetical protein [Actinomycetaceae bacterium]
MDTLLFTPITMNLAETTRMIEVARALPDYRCVFMGYEDDWAHLISQAGFEYRACEPSWSAEQKRQALALDQLRSLRHPFSPALVDARVRRERDIIADLNARAVIMGMNITSAISARAEGVPLFFAVPFAMTGPHMRQSRHLGIVPGRGYAQRFADRALSSLLRAAYVHAPLAPRSFSTIARRHEVEPALTLPALLTADVNMLAVMPDELEGYSLPENFTRIGPIFAHIDTPLPDFIHDLADSSRPVVYLGLGSSANKDFALRAAANIAEMNIEVIAPIRHYFGDDYAAAAQLPPNVHVTDILPAHQLGGLVDAAVLHGGQGTIQTACTTGIPFVGMGLQIEQRWNVQVCVKRGNALALSPRHVGTSALQQALQTVLSRRRFREAASTVRQAFAHEDGAHAAAQVIRQALA